MLRTDLASLGLQKCTETLPPQKHPFCVWKHQGDGRARQIKCISQTRMRLQTTRQTKRARERRSKVERRSARSDYSMISCALTFCLPSPLVPRVHLIWRGHVTASSWKYPALLPGRRAALTCPSGVPGTRQSGAGPQVPCVSLYIGRTRGSSAPWLTRSRGRRVPLRQLHVKSPAAAPGAPMRTGGVTRLPGTPGRRGLPSASRHRDVSTRWRSLSFSNSPSELQELWLCGIHFLPKNARVPGLKFTFFFSSRNIHSQEKNLRRRYNSLEKLLRLFHIAIQLHKSVATRIYISSSARQKFPRLPHHFCLNDRVGGMATCLM